MTDATLLWAAQHVVCVGRQAWALAAYDRLPSGYALVREADNADKLKDFLDELKPRYVFFLNWSRRVPDAIVEAYECVNFHCTPLPYGRGGHPIENMILNGYDETPIYAHRMTREIDAGPLYTCTDDVSLKGSKADILARFVRPVSGLIKWIAAEHPEPVPQTGRVVIFKRLTPDAYTKFWEHRE